MTPIYMPHKQRTSTYYLKKPLSILLFSALLVSTTYISPTGATTTHSWSTTTDFSNGTFTNTASTLPDSVSLSLQDAPPIDSTYEDFKQGYTLPSSTYPHFVTEDGAVRLGQSWRYTTDTTPAIGSNSVRHSYLAGDLLYVGTDGGLSVIDTKGTPDPADDTLNITYSTSSTPAIAGNSVYHSHLSGDLLYVSTSSGLSVIDTKGTPDPSDDTLVITYTTTSTPALANNAVQHSFLSGNYLYISTFNGGLSVIDTRGTFDDSSDDTLGASYFPQSTSILRDDDVSHAFLQGDLLYVSTWLGSNAGLYVIDTKGTIDNTDDTLFNRYHAAGNPAIEDNRVGLSFIEDNHLYISTIEGLYIIDLGDAADPSDETLLTRYHTGSNPALVNNWVYHSHLSGNLLYVSTYGSLSVIDTKGTPDPSDDELNITYTTTNTPAIGDGWVRHSHLSGGLLYVSTGDSGLSVINPSSEDYNPTTSFLSRAHSIITPSHFTLESLTPPDTSVSLQYRTGSSETLWQDEFNTLDSYAGDYYGYDGEYDWQSVTATGGVLRATGAPLVYSDWAYFVLTSGYPDDYFASGSVVSVRYRVLNRPTDSMDFGIVSDRYESSSYRQVTTDDWQTLTFTPDEAFSNIVIDLYTYSDSGVDLEGTVLEIDYVRITTRDWNPWSTPCTLTTCPINQADLVDANLIQYRLDLTTSDLSVTPSVNSVSLAYDYETTGTYTSDTLTFPQTTDLLAFTADTTVPTGTSLTFEYSTDGATWLPLSEGASLPSSTTTFTWRALLTTTDPSLSPLIHSVDLTYSPTAKSSRSSTTSVALQIANLTDQGKFEEASLLEDKFPSVSDNLNDITIRQEIIRLLRQIITLLERVAEMQKNGL
jgi:hypothetical protein